MGLLDGMFNMDDPQAMGLLNASSQILMGSGQTRQPFGIGQALGTGIQGYMQGNQAARARQQQEAEQAQQMQARAMQMEAAKREAAMQQQTMQEQERLRDFYSKGQASQQMGAQPGAQQAPGGMPAPQQGGSGESLYESMMQEAKALQGAGFIPQAQAKMKEALSVRPKFSTESRTVMGPDGKPMLIQMADDGTARPIQGGYGVAEQLHFGDNGQNIVGMDKYSGQVKSSLGKQQTLESMATDRRAAAGQAQADRHHNENRSAAFSKPFEVTGPDGTPILVQQTRNGIAPVEGYAPKGASKPLPSNVVKQLTEARDNATTMDRLSSDFKPEYGGKGIYGIGADLSMAIKGNTGQDQKSVAFWKDYRKNAELVERHAMFGASLTPGEQQSWRSADIAPGMDPEVIKTNLATRAALSKRVLASTEQDSIDAGHNPTRVSKIANRGTQEQQGSSRAVTLSDIAETARKSGRTTAEVTEAFRAKGYKIGGQ